MFETNTVREHKAEHDHVVGYRVVDDVWVCFDCDWTELGVRRVAYGDR